MASRRDLGVGVLAVAGAVMVAVTSGCSTLPDADELRAMATTDGAQLKRDSEEAHIRALIERFNQVEGLQHGYTVLTDGCTGPSDGGFKKQATVHLMTCSMNVSAVFGVEGDVLDVLRRIEDAGITQWAPHVNGPGSASSGTLDYAWQYHRLGGVFPDGQLMPSPFLASENNAVGVGWDHPPRPGEPAESGQLAEDGALVCPPDSPIYSRCLTRPERPDTVTALRARYGAVLPPAGSTSRCPARRSRRNPRGYRATGGRCVTPQTPATRRPWGGARTSGRERSP
ncbi:hypothetical protein PV721_31950 [Streptomyces sp. MB09-01]|uniref:hypothetical protein n=1 Tax=Streptomyces sp. MB09-01 TaxID=3028666 RepID=UPI0029A9A86D|nr:hypothetical protein [Streptomyces sp. MB09-01]MDX3538871.1 hypothetical protein [Streptomyces sp. MB09-01]